MESNPWIGALRHSHDALRASVGPLDEAGLRQQSYASEWSIAQVLSHLGSGAEIFGMFLDAGLSGAEPPARDAMAPIWQAWNERSPQAQAADGLAADHALVTRIESLGPEDLARVRLQLFGMDLDVTGLVRLRLAEHAVHSWDVAVALDPAATVAPGAVHLLADSVGRMVARAGKPAGRPLTVHVTTTDPAREFTLSAGETVTLEPAEASGDPGQPRLRLPAEAFLRLVYGRLDPAHTPPVEATGCDLDELRAMFPGI